jgi:two-component system, response regulator
MNTGHIEIVVVDDNPSDAELILESLAADQPIDRIQVIHDGIEALDFLLCRGRYNNRSPDAPPRLVLLDIKLPKVSGLEILQTLKSHHQTRAVPVVMLTSSNIDNDVARAYHSGANSYVQKPMDFARFRDVVRGIGAYWLSVNEKAPAIAYSADGIP